MDKTICRAMLASAIGLTMLAHAAAQEEIPAEKLIERLGSGSFSERERAGKLLQSRGPSVLPALRKAMDHPDLELRRRVQALIATLEAVRALEPKRVTLQGQAQPLAAWLAQIEKQTGIKVEAEGSDEDQTPYRCAVKNLPFWEALESVGRDSGRIVQISSDGLLLKKSTRRPPLVLFEGPFRLEATRFHEDRDIKFTLPGNDKELGLRDDLLMLTVSILVEPRFNLLAVESTKVYAALDESGESLGTPSFKRKYAFDRRFVEFHREAPIFLRRTSAQARTIKELRGEINVKVVVERKNVVIAADVAKAAGTKFRAGDDTLEVTKTSTDGHGGYSIKIAVPEPQYGVNVYWHNRLFLEDAKGNQYESNSRGTESSPDGQWISKDFTKPNNPDVGPATKLIFEDWVTLHHAIPFVFKDVP